MISVKRPGKLFIAGEYAVTSTGRYALVTPVDKFIRITVEKSSHGTIESFGGQILKFKRDKKTKFSSKDKKWDYVKMAINLVESYLEALISSFDNYKITIKSELESEEGIKYGLGSSGAVTVALIDAIALYYGIKLSKDQLFKLSVLATLHNSPLSSCGDLCAIAYENLLLYRKFDSTVILSRMKDENTYDLVNSYWESLSVEEVDYPDSWGFFVGWTGRPASSIKMLDRLRESEQYREFFESFSDKSDKICLDLYEKLKTNDFIGTKKSLKDARANILDLSNKLDLNIETRELRDLTESALKLGLAAKFSGAGAGDCGIALSYEKNILSILKDKWENEGIKYLEINIYRSKIDV